MTDWSDLDALVSYHYFRNPEHMATIRKLAGRGVGIIGDSGAYSALTQGARIDLDQFGAWAQEYRDVFRWIASLDVLGNPQASWANYQALRAAGVGDVVPTIHLHTPPAEMDRYVADGATLIGLGAVSVAPKDDAALRWLVACFRHARDHHPHVRFHGWGIAVMRYLRALPFWSVDSSGIGAAYRYGSARLLDPTSGRLTRVDIPSSKPRTRRPRAKTMTSGLAAQIRQATGYHLHDMVVRDRLALVSLGMAEATNLTRYLTARHDVAPPAGLPGAPRGTRVHFADSAVGTYQNITRVLDAT